MTDANPMVSIIMPVRNLEEYVGTSIDSVIGQSFKEWEIIIVNDGSVDDTERVVKSFADREPRIRYYSQEAAGVSTARNMALDRARGEYIAFLDGDDLWDPAFLEKCISSQSHTGADLIFCCYNRLMPGEKLKGAKMDIETALSDSGSTIRRFLTWKADFLMGNFLVRKSILSSGISFKAGCCFGEDTEFIYKVLTMAKETCYISDKLFTYRRRQDSATKHSWDWQKRHDAVDAMDRAYFFFHENYGGLMKNEIEKLFLARLDYTRYRLLTDMLKNGNFDAAHVLLSQTGWRQALQNVIGKYGFYHKIKARIINGEYRLAWYLIAFPYLLRRLMKLDKLNFRNNGPD